MSKPINHKRVLPETLPTGPDPRTFDARERAGREADLYCQGLWCPVYCEELLFQALSAGTALGPINPRTRTRLPTAYREETRNIPLSGLISSPEKMVMQQAVDSGIPMNVHGEFVTRIRIR